MKAHLKSHETNQDGQLSCRPLPHKNGNEKKTIVLWFLFGFLTSFVVSVFSGKANRRAKEKKFEIANGSEIVYPSSAPGINPEDNSEIIPAGIRIFSPGQGNPSMSDPLTQNWVQLPTNLFYDTRGNFPSAIPISFNSGTAVIDPKVSEMLGLDATELAALELLSSRLATQMTTAFERALLPAKDEGDAAFEIPAIAASSFEKDLIKNAAEIVGSKRGYLFSVLTLPSWRKEFANFGTFDQKIVVRDSSDENTFSISRRFYDPNSGKYIEGYNHVGFIPEFLRAVVEGE